jgi:hypothetical protein
MLRFWAHPSEWKTANCVVISKSGKVNCKSPSYRPISLLSCFYKVLATHDIEGAFNNTNPKVLEQIMGQRKMSTYIIQWVKEFTTDRLLSFCFDEISEIPKPFTGALPQRSPISPVLFAIVANAMLENPVKNNNTSSSVSYVDDVSLVQIGHGLPETVLRIKVRTEAQLERAAIIGLNFSSEKSELLHCIPNNSRAKTLDLDSHPLLEITIGNCSYTIKPARQIKQLGVSIDESLTLIPHSKTAASQGLKVLGKLRLLRHTKYHLFFGISPRGEISQEGFAQGLVSPPATSRYIGPVRIISEAPLVCPNGC